MSSTVKKISEKPQKNKIVSKLLDELHLQLKTGDFLTSGPGSDQLRKIKMYYLRSER